MIRDYIVGKFRFRLIGEIQEGKIKTKMWKFGQLVDEFFIEYDIDPDVTFERIAEYFANNYVVPSAMVNTTIFKNES